jgi:hypothetical protein
LAERIRRSAERVFLFKVAGNSDAERDKTAVLFNISEKRKDF